MPLMFMISGYVHGITERFDDGKGYLYHAKKNLISIYLPYLWVSYFGLTVSILIFSGSTNPINYNMAQLGEVISIPYTGFREYWFLCTLFQIKLVHTAFECRFRNHFIGSIFWITVFTALNCFRTGIPIYVYRLQFGMYFHIGYILQTRGLINSRKHLKLIYGLIIVTAGTIFHFIPAHNLLVSIVSAICSSIGLFLVFYALQLKPAFLTLAGSTSMVMFIMHDYVIFVLALLFKFTGIMRNTPFTASVLTLILAVSVPLLVVRMYQNIKSLRWIEYIFYPGKLFITTKAAKPSKA